MVKNPVLKKKKSIVSSTKKSTNAVVFFENMSDHALLELVESLKGKQHKGSRAILNARATRVATKRGLI